MGGSGREMERRRRGRFKSKAVERDFQGGRDREIERRRDRVAQKQTSAGKKIFRKKESAMASAEHRIDIPIEELELWWPECCIYDVPEILRKVKPEAYTPQLISIGPLHHNDEKLQPMEKQKKLYYHYFQIRLLDSHRNEALTKFKRFIESRENDILRCYSKKCDFSKQEFVEMILLDSVFIMELFLRKHIQPREDRLNQPKQEKDLLFSKLGSREVYCKTSYGLKTSFQCLSS
ncbi:hypothetical protein L6164_003576 [Bauhinia variegata]|uniref:Uncharacterized protein n=1 Tax=Bauhinia variegata TaxID=167791 RepID=A0ACB9Q185_BAUVA|nr:hypothetical protein L6164_003576 [Bauhinia variegata]